MDDASHDPLDAHGSTERALRSWRHGEALARRSTRELVRRGYGRATLAVLAALEACDAVDALVDAYDQERAALTHLADRACRELAEGDLLVRALVVDAACWWRLRELVAGAARARPVT